MKNRIAGVPSRWMVALGVALAGAIARPLLAADLSGTWDIASQVGQGTQRITLDVTRDGSSVTGTGFARVEGTDDSVRVEIRTAAFGRPERQDFHIVLVEVGTAAANAQELAGRWHGDEMSGRIDGAYGPRIFAGTRRRAD